MIILHIYCSYKLSTGGFQYGTFQFTPKVNDTHYFLTEENKLDIVSSAFDNGFVQRIKGKIPQKDSYLFLFKKLNYQYGDDHDDFGRDITMNMAFEFDKFTEYFSFVHSFEESEKHSFEQMARDLADCIVPDISITKYKLYINKNKFDLWLNNKLNQTNPMNQAISFLRITTDSSEKDLYKDDLMRTFDFTYKDPEVEKIGIKYVENTADYRIYPIKKKKIIRNLIKKILAIPQKLKILQKQSDKNLDKQSKNRQNKKYLIFFLFIVLIIITTIIFLNNFPGSSAKLLSVPH